MFFTLERTHSILKVDDNYARLEEIKNRHGYYTGDPDDLHFEFRYRVKQLDIVQKGTMTVRVTLLKGNVSQQQVIPANGDSREMIGNILQNVSNAKLASKEQERNVISRRNSDISAKINNEILPKLRAGVNPKDIQELRRTSLKLRSVHEIKGKNEDKPLLQKLAHTSITNMHHELSSSIEFDHRAAMHDLVLRQGIDPSRIFDLTHRSISSSDSFKGTVRTSGMTEKETDVLVKLLHKHIFDVKSSPMNTLTSQLTDAQAQVEVAELSVGDEIEIPIKMVISGKSLRRQSRLQDVSNFTVRFDLIDNKNGTVIDSVAKNLDVSKHVQLYRTPLIPPHARVSMNYIASKATIEIEQVDPGAQSVNVYKKVIHPSSVVVDDYEHIGNFSLTSQRSLNIHAETPVHSTIIYRIVPVGDNGTMGFEYTNAILNPSRYNVNKAIALNVVSIEQGVEIEANSLPPTATSIMILRRNKTTHEKNFTVVSGVKLIDEQTRESDTFSVVDKLAQHGHIYEYMARVVYKNGLSKETGNIFHEHFQVAEGKIDLKINDIQVDNSDTDPNVTFTIVSNVLDNEINIIKKLLEQQGVDSYFVDDLQQHRELFKGLVGYNVQRVNLTTGEIENFGTLTNDNFNDAELRTNNAVSPLRYECQYRYEVSALMRNSETLFEQFVKERIDPYTKKTYKFKPSKFLHPIALTEGVLVTSAGLRTKYTKDQLSHGKIGTVAYTTVSFNKERTQIVNLVAASFNRTLNVLTWSIQGNIKEIDHFLIMKEVYGIREIIGKAHCEFPNNNVQYLHPIKRTDTGEFRYIVKPIFNDYDIGIEAVSNAVVVSS